MASASSWQPVMSPAARTVASGPEGRGAVAGAGPGAVWGGGATGVAARRRQRSRRPEASTRRDMRDRARSLTLPRQA